MMRLDFWQQRFRTASGRIGDEHDKFGSDSEGRRRMNTKVKRIGTIIAFFVLSGVFVAGLVNAYSGGWRDDNQDYNCGTSCHSGDGNEGAGEIQVDLDKTSVLSGQNIAVTVNVTLVQLGGDSIIGVFLLGSQTGSDDHPTSQGWTISQDPNGGAGDEAYNYVEKHSPASGATVSFKWSLAAPATPGTYDLYVRVHHGSVARNALWEDYSGSISVEVSPLPPGLPIIQHSPVSIGYIEEPTLMLASVVNATKVFLHWREVGELQFNSLEMTNTSIEDENGWVFEGSVLSQGAEIQLEYQIIANRDTGNGPLVTDTAVFTLSIQKRPEVPNMTAWIIQIVIVTEAVIFVGIIGYKITKSKEPKEEDQDG
jgi:hypothetical protein